MTYNNLNVLYPTPIRMTLSLLLFCVRDRSGKPAMKQSATERNEDLKRIARPEGARPILIRKNDLHPLFQICYFIPFFGNIPASVSSTIWEDRVILKYFPVLYRIDIQQIINTKGNNFLLISKTPHFPDIDLHLTGTIATV